MQNYQYSDEYYKLFTKIINKNMTLVQKNKDGSVIKSGVFIDITVYDKIQNCKIIKSFDIFLWKLSQWCLIGKIKEKNIKKIIRNGFIYLIGVASTKYYCFLQRVLEKIREQKITHTKNFLVPSVIQSLMIKKFLKIILQ